MNQPNDGPLRPPHREYVAPTSLDEALDRKLTIQEEILLLEGKLSRRSITSDRGYSAEEQADWRARTCFRLNKTRAELLKLNAYITKRRNAVRFAYVNAPTYADAPLPTRLLAATHKLLMDNPELRDESKEARELLAAIDVYLQHRG